nr:translation initiation factor IF-2-like [Chrysemys picta bellii]
MDMRNRNQGRDEHCPESRLQPRTVEKELRGVRDARTQADPNDAARQQLSACVLTRHCYRRSPINGTGIHRHLEWSTHRDSTRRRIPHLQETQTKVVELDPLPPTATAVVNPVPETQPEPVPEPERAEQPVPEPLPALNPVLATPSATPTPEGTTETALAAAAKPAQEAQLEPEIQYSAPAESGSQSAETIPSPTLLPEGPSPSPQSSDELMSPASRKQFQANRKQMKASRKPGRRHRATHNLSALLINPSLL